MACVKGTEDKIGKPLWERLGQISGCANSSTVDVALKSRSVTNAACASLMDVMINGPILISQAPRTQVHQSRFFAAFVLGDIVA
jgi:hypothetical protein